MDSRPIKPLSRSRPILRVQSGPPVFTKNEIRHAVPGLISCVITWLLIASIYALVWLHKDRVISPYRKSHFDGALIGWGIVFGLNMASGLKGIALDLRWWVLNRRKRSDYEVNLILHCDSLTEITRLVFVSREVGIRLICGCWLFLNILIQTATASLSLTLPGDPGPADIYRTTDQSHMAIPDLAAFAPNPGRFKNGYLQECLAAYILGYIGSSYNYTKPPDKSLKDSPWADHPASFWDVTDHWKYVFRDSAPLNSTSDGTNMTLKAVSIYTDDHVEASATCQTPAFWLNRTSTLAIVNLNGTGEAAYFPFLPIKAIYYLTTPILTAQTDQCGPGCGNVKVLEERVVLSVPGSADSGTGYYYYDCNVTVSPTTRLSAINAAVAAQAIALSGELHPEIFTLGPRNNQWSSYSFDVPIGEPQNNSATDMASLLSRFAIGVIAAAAETNPKTIVRGHAPAQGVYIELKNPVLFSLILVLIGLIQSFLFGVAVKFGSRLEIPLVATSHQTEIQKRFASPVIA